MEMVNKSGNAGTASTSDSGHDFPSRFRGSRFVYLRLLREVANAWSDHRVSSMGAALAFYATFSIAPILVITIAIAGFFFGAEAARGEVVAQFHGLTGESGAKTIQTLLAATYNSGLGFWASVIAVITLLVAATSVFAELKNSLDVIWGAQKKAHSGIIALIRGRLLSFGLILTIGFLLLVSLGVSAILAALQKYWSDSLAGTGWLLEGLNSLFSFFVVFGLFAAIYKWLPDARIAWQDVGIGAAITAALFTLGKFLIGLYLGNSQLAAGFGAAGSLVVILLWVYYSSQIFFIGAEMTHAYAGYRADRGLPGANPASGNPAGRRL
ncbi:MAG: YihY/virulence factor BrkB family protein [Burkholderiales bacterium]|nr:YihY/virulence factor BrkB family protein [Burkholderiales bacterium]